MSSADSRQERNTDFNSTKNYVKQMQIELEIVTDQLSRSRDAKNDQDTVLPN